MRLCCSIIEEMAAIPQTVPIEWVIRLLVYAVGVGTTVGGSWISSKIHAFHDGRKAHLEDIKSNVLVPMRKKLEQFEPFVFPRTPLFCVERGTQEHNERARVTESSVEECLFLSPAFPTGWLFRGTEPALSEDARRNHFRKVTGELDKFVLHWVGYSGECQSWVARIARETLERSELPEFPSQEAEVGIPKPYVMHFELAIFVYERLFGLTAGALRLGQSGSPGAWAIFRENTTLAVGPREKLAALLEHLDGLLDSQRAAANELLNQAVELQGEFTQISRLLDFAIAARRLRKSCDLVTFF